MKNERIEGLDFFRGISAVFILLYHYTTRYNLSFGHIKQPYYFNVKYGYMAVAVFFILSGFLMYLKIDNEKPKKFAIKRIIRLYPAFITAMILTTVVMIISGDEFKSKVCNIKEWILNLTMLPELFRQKPVDGVYWTLQIEIIFYAIIWLIILMRKQDKIKIVSLIWISISVIVNVLIIQTDNLILKAIRIFGITQYCQLFITGIIMCCFYKNENSKINYLVLVLCLLNQLISLGLEYTIFLLLFDIVFYFIVIRKIIVYKFINNKFILKISEISYPLYLTHQFIGFAIINKIEKLGLTNEIYIIIPIITAVFIAFIIHKYIEKPSYSIFSKYLLNNKQKGELNEK